MGKNEGKGSVWALANTGTGSVAYMCLQGHKQFGGAESH